MGVFDDFEAKRPAAPSSGSMFDDFEAKRSPEHRKQSMWDSLRGHLPTRKQVGQFLRPTLEGTGAVVGATVAGTAGAVEGLGTPASPVLAAAQGVAGGALGFAGGKRIADWIEGEPPPTVGSTVKDVATGAQYEMGGQIAGHMLGKVAGSLKRSWDMGVPGSARRNMFKAAQEFGAAAEGQPEYWKTTDSGFADRGKPTDMTRVGKANEARLARDQALIDKLNKKRTALGLKPLQMSAGQKEGGPLLALEQSQRLKYKNKPATAGTPTFDERVLTNNALIADAARTEMEAAIPRGKPVPTVEDASATGRRIVTAIKQSEAAVKPEVKRLFDHPSFNYEMPRDEFDQALTAAGKDNWPKQTQKAIKEVAEFAKKADRTSAGLKSIKETIDGFIGQAAKSGDKRTVAAMTRIKQGVMDSFETMGKAAEAGDVALADGKIIYPGKIKAQLTKVEADIATETERLATAAPKTSVKDLQAAVKAGGAPPNVWMQQVNETPAQFEARLTKDFQRLNPGKPLPTNAAAPADRTMLEKLTADRDALTATLAKAKPAEDVATAYSSALKYTREEQKDRFARDTIKGILKPGDQYGGLATPVEAIPDKVWTPSGAREFVRSQMPFKAADATADQAARMAAGRKAAGELAYPHMVRKFATSGAIDPKTGILQIPAALKFARDNAPVLRELGLTGELDNIIRGQLRGAIDHNLSLRGVDAMQNPTMTSRLAKRFVKEQFGPAVRRYFPNAGRAMDDWARTLEIAERSNVKATLQGPNTAEKLDLLAIGDKVSMFAAVLGKVGWLVNSLKGAVGTIAKQPMELSKAAKDQIIQNGLMDDEVAKALKEIYKAHRFTDISQTTATVLKRLMVQLQIDPQSGVAAASLAAQGGAAVLGGAANMVGGMVNPQQGAPK